MIRFGCPKCQTVLQAAAQQAGAAVACPRCQTHVRVPASTSPGKKVATPPAVAAPLPAPWYYARAGERHGPFTTAQLRQRAQAGELQPTDSVWKEGMPSWRPASEVKGLFNTEEPAQSKSSGPAPPPLLPGKGGDPFGDLAEGSGPQDGSMPRPRKHKPAASAKKKYLLIGTALALPVLLIVAVVLMRGKATKTALPGNPGEQGRKAGEQQEAKVVLPDFSKLDYTRGPKGQKLETRQRAAQGGGPPFLAEGFVNDRGEFMQHGRTVRKYPSGKIQQEMFCFNGQDHGPSKSWHESGKPAVESYFVKDKRHGRCVLWSESGQVILDVVFRDGRFARGNQRRDAFVKVFRLICGQDNSKPTRFIYAGVCRLGEFVETFGKPDKEQPGTDRSERYWTYQCADGSLTMSVVGTVFWTKAPDGEIQVYGEDNFPSVKAGVSTRNMTRADFSKRLAAMMKRGVMTRPFTVFCDSDSFFQTFGLPERSTVRKKVIDPWIHHYPLKDGTMRVTILQAGEEINVRE